MAVNKPSIRLALGGGPCTLLGAFGCWSEGGYINLEPFDCHAPKTILQFSPTQPTPKLTTCRTTTTTTTLPSNPPKKKIAKTSCFLSRECGFSQKKKKNWPHSFPWAIRPLISSPSPHPQGFDDDDAAAIFHREMGRNEWQAFRSKGLIKKRNPPK